MKESFEGFSTKKIKEGTLEEFQKDSSEDFIKKCLKELLLEGQENFIEPLKDLFKKIAGEGS